MTDHTPTPRTAAEVEVVHQGGLIAPGDGFVHHTGECEMVSADFARTLERELAEARTQINVLKGGMIDLTVTLDEARCALAKAETELEYERGLVSRLQGAVVEQTVRADEAEAQREAQRALKFKMAERASELRTELAEVQAEARANAAYAEELRVALAEVVRISDRKHDAWDAARAALAKNSLAGTTAQGEAERPNGAGSPVPGPSPDRPTHVEPLTEELHRALVVVLPMAKGYAHEHPVGDNEGKVKWAQEIAEKFAALEVVPRVENRQPTWAEGMERAVALCKEEEKSAEALITENPGVRGEALARLQAAADTAHGLAQTIRAFQCAGPECAPEENKHD